MTTSFLKQVSAVGVSLALVSAAGCTIPESSGDEEMLTDSVWQLQQIQFNDGTLITPSDPANYTVDFMDDGQLSIRADCNQVLGEYTGEGGILDIVLGPSTLAACGPDSIDTEFTQALSNASLYFFQEDDLFIDLAFDSGTMQLSPAPADMALVGTVWELEQIQYNNDTLLVADPPENYTIEFMADGSIAIQADCNRGRGEFSSDDSSIDITVGALTRAACPPGSISDEFVQGLNNSAIYFFQDGKLFMDIQYDTGTMRFRPAQ